MRLPASLGPLCLMVLLGACDPGGQSGPSDDGAGAGGSTVVPQETNPLLLLPDEPPGTVDLSRPPAAGELDPFEENTALGRGMNLGNGLDAPTEGAWGPVLKPYMFEVLAEAGFDSIRLPVKWSGHADAEAPYSIDPTFLARVDWAIAHALTRGLRVVLDIHHYDELYDEPAAHRDRFLALWTQLAKHYQDYPKELYFEILNEPRGSLENQWNAYLGEAVTIIRSTNPGRTIVIGGGEFNKWYTLKEVEFPVDSNVIATFHYYNPYCFTLLNTGATWDRGCSAESARFWPVLYPTTDANPTGTEDQQRNLLAAAMQNAADWGSTNGYPLYLGEFGVDGAADAASRIAWTTAMARAAEEHGMSHAYWEFAANMGAFSPSTMTWKEGMLEALIPPTESGPGGEGGAGSEGGAPGQADGGAGAVLDGGGGTSGA